MEDIFLVGFKMDFWQKNENLLNKKALALYRSLIFFGTAIAFSLGMKKSLVLYKERNMKLTSHAVKRASQRGINLWDMQMAHKYGKRMYRTGVMFIFLRRKDLPSSIYNCSRKLDGITLLVCPKEDTVITVYRNKQALQQIKRKGKRKK